MSCKIGRTKFQTLYISFFCYHIIIIIIIFSYIDIYFSDFSDPEFLCNILVMADQLLIPRLIQVCEKQLTNLLTLKNVGEILQFSHDFNAEQLNKTCKDFVCYNLGALLETKGLDTADIEVLEEVSKHYQNINRALASRKITPYSYGPSTDDIENHASALDITVEELFEMEAESQLDQILNNTSTPR